MAMTRCDNEFMKLEPLRASLLAWYRAVMLATGWNANQWAKEAGLAATTVSRFLDKPATASTPTWTNLYRLAAAIPGAANVQRLPDAPSKRYLSCHAGAPPFEEVDVARLRRAILAAIAARHEAASQGEEFADDIVAEVAAELYQDRRSGHGQDVEMQDRDLTLFAEGLLRGRRSVFSSK